MQLKPESPDTYRDIKAQIDFMTFHINYVVRVNFQTGVLEPTV